MKKQLKKIVILLFLGISCIQLYGQGKIVDSLKFALKNAKEDSIRCNILEHLTNFASDEEWPGYNEQLFKLAEKNLATLKNLSTNNQRETLKQKNFYLKNLAYSLQVKGFLFVNKGNNSKGLEFYNASLKIFEELKNKMGIGILLNNIGNIYMNQGDIPKALEYFHSCLKVSEEINDKKGIARILNNIAFLYQGQGEISKTLDNYQKSLAIQIEINDEEGAAYSLNNIGLLYYNNGDLTKGLEYFFKSLEKREKISDKIGKAQSLINIGGVYRDKGDLAKALEFYNKSLLISEEINDKEGMAYSLNNIAGSLFKMGNLDKALNYGKRSLQTAKELGFPINIKNAANVLSKIYKKQNNFKDALLMYELEISMRDSVTNEANKKASIKSQLKYEYEKRAAADSVKNAEAQKVKDAQLQAQSASLKQEKTQRYALYGGLVLVAGFLIFVINRFRVTNAQKKIIEKQKIVVDEAFEKLEMKQKEIMDSIHYAQRIQKALITSEFLVEKMLKKIKK